MLHFPRITYQYHLIQQRIRYLYWSLALPELGVGTKFYGPVHIGRPNVVSIGKYCTLNRDVMINARSMVTIGDHVRIAPRVIINSDGLDYEASREKMGHKTSPIIIKDGAWIGAGSIICPGVTIGEDAAVAAGSVVLQDVPARTLVFGVPARAVKEIEKRKDDS